MPAVALLTVGWVLATLALAWWWFGIGMAMWADEQSDSGAHWAGLHHQEAVAAMWLAGAAVGGPALIAVVAFATRMPKAGTVYVVLAVVLSVPVLPIVARAGHTLAPPPPPSPVPTVCQEHSGGDTRCPGG
ncbi:hypothetical protein KRMM14A1004_56460 [Krasilnikovia sp. MM14-A1004]